MKNSASIPSRRAVTINDLSTTGDDPIVVWRIPNKTACRHVSSSDLTTSISSRFVTHFRLLTTKIFRFGK